MKQKILIFEGHDCTGKTNIATAISGLMNLEVYKNKRESKLWWDAEVDFKYGVDNIIQLCEQWRLSGIFDRFHASEYAYGKTYDRKPNVERIFDFDERLANMNAIIVYCFKDKEQYEEDETKIIETEKYDIIKKYYEEFLSKTKCKVLKINTSDRDLNKQVATIVSFVDSSEGK